MLVEQNAEFVSVVLTCKEPLAQGLKHLWVEPKERAAAEVKSKKESLQKDLVDICRKTPSPVPNPVLQLDVTAIRQVINDHDHHSLWASRATSQLKKDLKQIISENGNVKDKEKLANQRILTYLKNPANNARLFAKILRVSYKNTCQQKIGQAERAFAARFGRRSF